MSETITYSPDHEGTCLMCGRERWLNKNSICSGKRIIREIESIVNGKKAKLKVSDCPLTWQERLSKFIK
jgi:acyl CoA:acetate/3-ketoacid CoA transferase alpha subunit